MEEKENFECIFMINMHFNLTFEPWLKPQCIINNVKTSFFPTVLFKIVRETTMIMEAIIKMETLSCFFFCPLFFFEKSTFRDFRFASLEHKKSLL